MAKKTDSKTVASKQDYEMEYVCSVWYSADGKHLKIAVLRDVVKKTGKSRRCINAVLRYLGYQYSTKK
mgnify:CR=1 FL=1